MWCSNYVWHAPSGYYGYSGDDPAQQQASSPHPHSAMPQQTYGPTTPSAAAAVAAAAYPTMDSQYMPYNSSYYWVRSG